MVAIQLRSNLNNKGSLKALTATVAVPPTVIGTSLEIKQGEGIFDDLKRTITWTLKELPVGKSLMFGFEVDILASLSLEEVPKVRFTKVCCMKKMCLVLLYLFNSKSFCFSFL